MGRMPGGTPVNRQWVVWLKNGDLVIDWDGHVFQDVFTGAFIKVLDNEISHHPLDHELDYLIKTGQVASYDLNTVKFLNLPERPQPTIE